MNDYQISVADDLQRLDNVIADMHTDKRALEQLPWDEKNVIYCAIAYHLQQLYTGLEKIMEKSLASLGVKVEGNGMYHARLQKEYFAKFECDEQERRFLTDTKNFRHVVRAAYGFPLNGELVMKKWEAAITLWPRIKERVIRQMDLPPPPEGQPA